MIKKWSLKSKSLLFKVGLALGVIAVGSGSIVGAMIGFAENSSEKNGTLSPVNKSLFDNDYSKIYDQNGVLNPELRIINGTKSRVTAKISEDATKFWFLDNTNKKYGFDDFFNEYFRRYGEPFVLEIKYGSFSFFDEYVLAVRPKQFLEFCNWFITNVAWGPDLLTLDSFRLVPGVEQNGNAITLGSHSTLHKEVSEIKFFPDAFFGSLPIYSSLSGVGNSDDALTYSVFASEASKKNLDHFLNNIPFESALKNDLQTGFGEIYRPSKLKDESVKVYLGTPTETKDPRTMMVTSTTYEQPVIVSASFSETDLGSLKEKYPSLASVTYQDFGTYKIKAIKEVKAPRGANQPSISLTLSQTNDQNQETTKEIKLDLNDLTDNKFISYKSLLATYKDKINSFLNFYDIDAYKDKEFYLYKDNKNINHFYKLFVEAINENNELKELIYPVQQKRVKKYKLLSFEKTTNEQAKEYTLKANLQDLSTTPATNTSLEFVANKSNDYSPAGFDDFLDAIGYKGGINPISLFYSPTDSQAKDEEGNPLTGLDSRSYQVYAEVYNGLIKKVVKKYPYLLRQLDGPHIEQSIDNSGVYQYKVVEGKFRGFTPNDRIGIPTVLSALVPGFDGLPIDFLKYVATHEYGHHYTLDQGNAYIDKNNPVVVGGLSTRGGANDASFYSYEALINYLEARTNLEIVRVNANGEVTDTGKFIRFRFGILDENNKVIRFETEKIEDIWGTDKANDKIGNVLKNKKRRFLQDFAGIVEAAKLRGVALSDLFFANAFDSDSGTLNPSISGIAKAFMKKQEAMQTPEYKWVQVTAQSIISQLTDGAGNPLLNKSVFVSENDKLTFKIYETQSGKNNVITKINMFNKDGTPVIQVPLNVELTADELAYVDKQVKIITDSITATINKRLSDNGWDGQGTVLGGEISSTISTVFGSQGVETLVEKIKTRNGTDELNSAKNGFDDIRQSYSYFAIDPGLTNEFQTLLFGYFNIEDIAKAIKKGTWKGGSDAYVKSDANKILALLKKGSDSITDFSKYDKYVFPYVSGNKFLGEIANVDDGISKQIKSVARENDLKVTSGLFNKNFVYSFLEAVGVLSKPINARGDTDSFISYVEGESNNQNKNVLEGFVQLNRKINAASIKPGTNTNGMRGQPASGDEKKTALKKIEDSTFLTFNPYSVSSTDLDKKLLESLKNNLKVDIYESTTSDVKKTSIKAKDLNELLAFGSLDYSKATYDSTTKQYNWNVDYAKSKFELAEIEKLVSTDTSEESKPLRDAVTAAGSNSTAKDQALANYAIYLFRHSNLFITVKDFSPATDLVKNQAVFSKLYGITMLDRNFNKYYVDELTSDLDAAVFFDADRLQKYFAKFITDNKLTEVQDRLSLHDLLLLSGNILWYANRGKVDFLFSDFLFGDFSPGLSSSDVINYNDTRIEPLLNDKFTDYVYSIAETLTRDYVQTTYVPNSEDFVNTPSYLKGLSEAISGLDYIVDGTKIAKLNEGKYEITDLASSLEKFFVGPRYTKYYEELITKQVEPLKKIKEAVEAAKQAEANFNKVLADNGNDMMNEAVVAAKEEQTKAGEALKKAQNDFKDLKAELRKKIFGEFTKKVFKDRESRSSNYFGRFISKNNGYFKDHFEKETIGSTLYDDNRDPIIDSNIRTKDFKGNKVTNRPEAFFLSQLYNYGVSKRSVSGLFRNKYLDALALYGYVSNDLAKKISYLRFTDERTNQAVYLKVNTKKTNNIFWLQKQGDASTKKTIEDYGYTSWLTDYAVMGKYRDALLKPGHSYQIDFVDSDYQFVEPLDLGNVQYISENAKAVEQSPIKIENMNTTDDQNNKKIKTVISVDYQFNVNN
ncbi:PDxFFG protein [Mycoplasma bradburyae]|uniref:PDxFFG protein n=1 Tax=Mycoplasma bradburyae TaxID=2963128 RepID=A0AAW6HP89_9MOLU|nr:PDxFFG protein [Mycoplasma bradburyae]MDC4183129.1 PDxFFG protein [Mycoplasma bradburyae]UTS70636.1 PDxFFG protein [Mycoplasma bradburyae]